MEDTSFNLLLLQLAQAKGALDKAQNNSYSDQHKDDYYKELQKLFNSIQIELVAAEPRKLDDTTAFKKRLDFIFSSLEFLDSSTLNQIPYEIVTCLDYAMKDWLEPQDQFIIVTSLNNNISHFSFDRSLAIQDQIYLDIKQAYEIEFKHRLVQINLPKTLSRDYFAAVILYHELGHFIDLRFKFMDRLARQLTDSMVNNSLMQSEVDELNTWLPTLSFYKQLIETEQVDTSEMVSDSISRIARHLGEYFSDLFAAQYIGKASSLYLSYISENNSSTSTHHPSTTNRVQVVKDFLAGTPNAVVKHINNALGKRKAGAELKLRFEHVDDVDFFKLLPIEVIGIPQLHGLFDMAWRIWFQQRNELAKVINDTTVTKLRLYNVINNLIEKSIGNFITLDKWTKIKASVMDA